ncbi:MAG: copper homeostasis protein CutC [Nakamurella sp.]
MATPGAGVLTEVCVDSVAGVRIAAAAGADRVELCSGLEVGGLTPSAALIEHALAATGGSGLAVHVLIRPRSGDFRYSIDEIRCMERDVAIAVELGARGVVIGALNVDGSVDLDVTSRLVAVARAAGRAAAVAHPRRSSRIGVTFHRAFDLTADPFAALEAVRLCGIERILTSGQAAGAAAGAVLLRKLVSAAGSGGAPIAILAGGGIGPDTVADLISTTGVREVHFSGRRLVRSTMQFAPDGVSMGAADSSDRMATDPDTVRATIAAARSAG